MADMPFAVAPPNSPTRQAMGIPVERKSVFPVNEGDDDEIVSTDLVETEDAIEMAEALKKTDLRMHNTRKENADLLLKLMMVSSSVAAIDEIEGIDEVGKGVCSEYNGLISRIMQRKTSEDDVTSFRNMLKASVQMLDDVLRNPIRDGVVIDAEDNRLTVGMVDLLKTALQIKGCMADRREYSRRCRSMEGQGMRDLCMTMKSRRPFELEAYATGEQMHSNFDEGVRLLSKLADQEDDCLLAVIEDGRQNVRQFMTSFLLPTILDNRRMKAASVISARFYGNPNEDPEKVFGSTGLLGLVFDSCSSIVSITRSTKTICALLTMGYVCVQHHYRCENIKAGISEPQATTKALADAAATPYCNEITYFLSHKLKPAIFDTFNFKPLNPDAPGTNTAIYSCVADWFEKAVRDKEKSNTLMAAFTYEGFCVNEMHPAMQEMWNEFNESNGVDKLTKSFSLWYVADFLVSARAQLHDNELCGTNILSTAMTVLSGAIGTLMEPNLGSPFKFDDYVTDKTNKLSVSILQNDKRLCLRTAKTSRKRQQKVNTGKTCKATKITAKVMNRGKVRSQNDKSVMMDTRLSVCIFMLSLSEEIKKDISQSVEGLAPAKRGAHALVSEGRKDGRRLYIIALETLPNANFARCRETQSSHLIEKSRKNPSSFETTGDNTEKPFRDLVGGAVLNTILYPLAGNAFVGALQDIVDCYGVPGHVDKHGVRDDHYYFKSTTNTCVNHFVSRLEDRVEKTFDVRSIMADTDGPVRVGLSDFKEIFLQQKSFANRICDVIKDCGTLWEDMQLSFAVQKSDNDDDAVDTDAETTGQSPGRNSTSAASAGPSILQCIEAPEVDDDDFPVLGQVPMPAVFDNDDIEDLDDVPEADDNFDDEDEDEFEEVSPTKRAIDDKTPDEASPDKRQCF